MNVEACSKCDRAVYAKGMCMTHYKAAQREERRSQVDRKILGSAHSLLREILAVLKEVRDALKVKETKPKKKKMSEDEQMARGRWDFVTKQIEAAVKNGADDYAVEELLERRRGFWTELMGNAPTPFDEAMAAQEAEADEDD